MNPPTAPRPKPKSIAAWKEIRLMSHRLNRFLDASASVTIVFLALYVSVSAFGLGA